VEFQMLMVNIGYYCRAEFNVAKPVGSDRQAVGRSFKNSVFAAIIRHFAKHALNYGRFGSSLMLAVPLLFISKAVLYCGNKTGFFPQQYQKLPDKVNTGALAFGSCNTCYSQAPGRKVVKCS
jgi:hypothetical protein